DGAIRNYSRQGYRFCLDDSPLTIQSADSDPEFSAPLEAARCAFARHDWDRAAALFTQADLDTALHAADLEHLAEAHECAGRMHESLPLLERAAAAYAARGDANGVARSALRLAIME